MKPAKINQELLREAGMCAPVIAVALQITESAVYNKLAGRRTWALEDVPPLLKEASKRLSRPVTYEEMFGTGVAQMAACAAGGKRQ